MSFNQKYRPQKISELDLSAVREGLGKILSSEKIPHAFLFAGPKGTGKTSAARIVAKAVNCQNNVYGKWSIVNSKEKKNSINHKPLTINDAEPCNKCEQCLSITAGRNMDVLEIDAASNRGIDDIRDLREKVKLAPVSSLFKVYIIDEAHMLTTEAFNALLKTLEEPPKHVIFILCTTEPEKLPETIISRCSRFNFKKAKGDEIIEKLKKVVRQEKLEAEDAALDEISRGARGSFRDALKILEQVSSGGGKITADDVREVLGHTVGIGPEKLLEFLVAKDTKGAIKEINRVVEGGANLRIYTEGLLEMLRVGLLIKLGIEEEGRPSFAEASEGKKLGISDLKRLIEIFGKAALELKDSIIPQLPLELAVVEWSESGGDGGLVPQSETSVDRPDDLGGSPPVGGSDETGGVGNRSAGHGNGERVGRSSSTSLEEVQSRWKDLLLAVRPRNYSIEAFLRASRPVGFEKQVMTIEVFYQFHRDKLDSAPCRAIIEEVASELFGAPICLRCVLSEKPKVQEEVVVKKSEPIMDGDEDIFAMAEKIFSN